MMNITNRALFNLPLDCWTKLKVKTADAARIKAAVIAAIETQAFVSVVGPRGAGKTSGLRAVLQNYVGTRIIEPLRLTRDKLHMGDIESAIVRDLSDESPRHSGEARSHQVRRILGEASQEHNILLVIDDAHVLHHQTLRALKRLRELAWLGKAPLLGICLLGQSDRLQNIPEVALRSSSLALTGLSNSEIKKALATTIGAIVDVGVIELLSDSTRAKNWLDLQALVDSCIAEAIAVGKNKITPNIAEQIVGKRQSTKSEPPTDAAVSAALKNRAAAA